MIIAHSTPQGLTALTETILTENRKDNTQTAKTTPHNNGGKGATLVPGTAKLLHHWEEEKKVNGEHSPYPKAFVTT
jgi:hypothetical protein